MLTLDGEHILTCQIGNGRGCVEKYSLSSKSLIGAVPKYEKTVQAMNCSRDNKWLFVGYEEGVLEIIEIQSFTKILCAQILPGVITVLDFTEDNQSAYIVDFNANIKK